MKNKKVLILMFVLMLIITVGCGKKQDKEDTTDRLEEIKEKFTNYKWPNSKIASLLPEPKSKIGEIEWEASYGFVIYVGETTKEEFAEYAEQCSLKGFNVDYRKGDEYYFAKNSNGYDLTLQFEGENIMFIRLDAPDDKTTNNNSNNGNINNNNNISSTLTATQNENFAKALKECNIDPSKVTNLNKSNDWSNGQRYSFNYKNDTLWLYLNDDDSISSINLNLGGLHIYDEKYESLNYEDFSISYEDITNMEVKAESRVDDLLKYPSTGKYTWNSYQRTKEYYKIVGSVKAKNSLNVEVTNIVEVEFKKSDNLNIIYVGIDGEKYSGKAVYPEINRTERKIVDNSTLNEITLNDGIVGNYGKYDTFDGEKYLRYYVPNGKYKVTALVKNSMFYIESIILHKEDGYDTADTYNTIKLNNKGDTIDIEVKDGQCISLVMNTKIKLVKVN